MRWLPVVGYDGFYEVSDSGQVRSCDRVVRGVTFGVEYEVPRRGKIMKPTPDKNGYLCLRLSVDGKQKGHKVHRIVALAFIGAPPPGKDQVNHLDCVKHNNHVDNLEWCSNSENHRHAYRNGVHALNLYRDSKGRNSDGTG